MSRHNWKYMLTVAALSLAGQFPQPAYAAADDDLARSILEKADQIRTPQEGYQVEVKINTAVPGQGTEERKYRILSKGNENTIVQVVEPAVDRGQIMLMRGRELYVFMPSVSQPIRL